MKHLSRKVAIMKKCLSCGDGGYKDRESCLEIDCPLHPYRLGKCEKGKSTERSLAIKQFCTACCCGDRQETVNCSCTECPLYEYHAFTTQKVD